VTKLREIYPLFLIIVGAVALKAVLLALDVVPFNSDEAVVALMARHILRGERPWFFYGQAYMGSLDAYLVAGAFRIWGERVLSVRVVQVALFVAVLVSGYPLALRFTGSRRVALVTVLLLAFPPVLLTLYTTASLGGYDEALLVGNLLLWWGHRLGWEDVRRWRLWLAWGGVAGLGFWAFGLTLVYLLPVALWLLWRLGAQFRPGQKPWWQGYLFAAMGFAVGSLPWWWGNLGRVSVAVAELSGSAVRSTVTPGGWLGNVGARALSFVILGLPALFGLRFPWSVAGPPLWLAVPVLALYLGALIYGLRRRTGATACSGVTVHLGAPPGFATPASAAWQAVAHQNRIHLRPNGGCKPPSSEIGERLRSGYLLLWGVCGTLFLGFILTPFGGDPSGRYFLPFYVPLFVFTADALVSLQEHVGRWAWALLGTVLAFHLVGTAQAAWTNPPGVTTQFEAITQVDHRYDAELIDFLRAHGGARGYGNYWVAYPIAFLSDEEIILVPRLPYKADLRYTSRDDRYAPYGEWVQTSSAVVYVTTNHPELDRLLRGRFAALGVDFREAQIGDYHIFYDLSRKVTPEELSLWG
jgi:hypothetical protein